jgi:hypothetical protein
MVLGHNGEGYDADVHDGESVFLLEMFRSMKFLRVFGENEFISKFILDEYFEGAFCLKRAV